MEDLDLVEANEAFAAQALGVTRELKWDLNKVNVNGGAIALGHRLASGCRVLVTLLHEMQRRDAKKGLATRCASAAAWASPWRSNAPEPEPRIWCVGKTLFRQSEQGFYCQPVCLTVNQTHETMLRCKTVFF